MKTFILLLLSLCSISFARADSTYSAETVLGWTHKSFLGNTDYSLVFDETLQQDVILAQSQQAASGLFFEEKIDLNKTPWLSWSWRIKDFPKISDERSKSGDDFAARLYVLVKDGWGFWNTKAISYVWSEKTAAEQTWPNPFTGKKAMMLVARSGPVDAGWVTEKRNIKDDLKKLFGKEFRYISAIAIMTDTDNSKSTASSFYANIGFSKQ
jgi:hypothetical protein